MERKRTMNNLTVTDALRMRKSVSAFNSQPVDLTLVQEILELAGLSPSGGNIQPWKVDILTGRPLTELAQKVKRTGSAGDNPAPDILDDWLTATQVNTERGRNELAKGGNQSITTIEIPLTDTNTAPGLIEPGMLVEVMDTLLGESGDWRGLCLATNVTAERSKVLQSIQLERHY